jgi:glycosyltransferase involved in cell wall biosynthesis
MLPRLCYIGPQLRDSIAGPGQLFRLLSSYPADRLLTVQSPPADRQVPSALDDPPSTLHDPTVRIPSFPALRSPRARTLYELTFLFGRSVWAAWLEHRLRHRPCDAVLSLAHGWLCEPALQFARRRHLPFYLILHDHPRTTLPVPRVLGKYRLGRWRRLCRAAAACLCISPYMAEHVRRLTGRASPVLYPGLAPDARLSAWEPPADDALLTFAFAGSLHGPYRALLETLARELACCGHRLLLHCPGAQRLTPGPADRAVTDAGWVPPHALATTLRAEADVLFLPMSFLRADRSNMRVAFPSKLAEYCAAGRPVLLWGPPIARPAAGQKPTPASPKSLTLSPSPFCARRLPDSLPIRTAAGGWGRIRCAWRFNSSRTKKPSPHLPPLSRTLPCGAKHTNQTPSRWISL